MPELPEVETSLRGISPHILKHSLQKVQVRNPRLRWPVETQKLKSLVGATLKNSYRRAKYIVLQFGEADLILHLGMSGSLRIEQPHYQATKHDHVILHFGDCLLVYHDPRRFGCVLYSQNAQQHALLSKLGPEPLERRFNQHYFYQSIRGSNRTIKTVIMDNHIVTGVGNIYACESLYLAGIDPRRPAGQLDKDEAANLVKTIKQVLRRAIKAGGTTLRDFVNSTGKPGYFQQKLYVYNQLGKPCPHCNQAIMKITQNQRSTFFCPQCQH